MKIKSGVYLKQAGMLLLELCENCGEEGYGGEDGSLVVAHRFKEVFGTRMQIRLLAACARSCEERFVWREENWGIMGEKPTSSLTMHIPFVTY